jgi:hypothetical protein
MRRNLTTVASIFGAAMVVSSVVLVGGAWLIVDRAAGRFEAAMRDHGRHTERAGEHAGDQIGRPMTALTGVVERHAKSVETAGEAIGRPAGTLATVMEGHAKSVEHAGETISKPQIPTHLSIDMNGAVKVAEPLEVKGPYDDGSLPVKATIGK